MFRILIPCLIWLSTVRSDTGMHMDTPGEPLMDKMSDISALKPKRDSIHCGPFYPHAPAYAPPPVYVKPYVHQQTYLKKELGVQPLDHLQYAQQPAYTSVVAKPSVSYVKPIAPAVTYQTMHQSAQYVKPIMPVYHKPLSYPSIYQKPLYYAPMYQAPMYHDVMPNVFVKKYEAPVAQVLYQKPLIHAPVQYAASPKVVQVQAPQVSYVKPVVHSPPLYGPPPTHDSVIVKPHCL